MASKTTRKSAPSATAVAATAVATIGDSRPVRPTAERASLVAQAAYFRAEQRGFAGSDSLADWLAAEQDIDAAWRFE